MKNGEFDSVWHLSDMVCILSNLVQEDAHMKWKMVEYVFPNYIPS